MCVGSCVNVTQHFTESTRRFTLSRMHNAYYTDEPQALGTTATKIGNRSTLGSAMELLELAIRSTSAYKRMLGHKSIRTIA